MAKRKRKRRRRAKAREARWIVPEVSGAIVNACVWAGVEESCRVYGDGAARFDSIKAGRTISRSYAPNCPGRIGGFGPSPKDFR